MRGLGCRLSWPSVDGIIRSMEGSNALRAFRRTIQDTLRDVLAQRFFHDRLSMTVLTLALVVNVASIVILALQVRPTDSQVPVHFSSFTLFDALGPWYYPFEIALVAAGITVVNMVFAYHSFGRSRLASFFLLVTALVVAIFSFIIAQAFGAVR
jgi:hypothetical protein